MYLKMFELNEFLPHLGVNFILKCNITQKSAQYSLINFHKMNTPM